MTRTLLALAAAPVLATLLAAQEPGVVVTRAEPGVLRPTELQVQAYPIPLTTSSLAPPAPAGYSASLLSASTLEPLDVAAPPVDSGFCVLSSSDAGGAPAPAGLRDGLVGAWSFDRDARGPLVNRAEGAARLEVEGGEWAAGNAGDGLGYDGSTAAYVTETDAHDTARDFSLAAWVRTERNNGPLFMRGEQWGVSVTENGISARFGDGEPAASKVKIADGRWHHVALAWSAEERVARLSIDGEPALRAESSAAPATVDEDLGLGVLLRYRFEGALDDVRLWSRALDDDELRAMYAAGNVPDVCVWSVLRAPGRATWRLDPVELQPSVQFGRGHPGGTLELLEWRGHPTLLSAHLRELRASPGRVPETFRVSRLTAPDGVQFNNVGMRSERVTLRAARTEWLLDDSDPAGELRWTRGTDGARLPPLAPRFFADPRRLPEFVRPPVDEDGGVRYPRRNLLLVLDHEDWGPLDGALLRFAPTGQVSRLLRDPDEPSRAVLASLPLNLPSVRSAQPALGRASFYTVSALDGALLRIDGTGQALGAPTAWRTADDGVELTFDLALDRARACAPSSWSLELSGDVSGKLAVDGVELSEDGRTVFLRMARVRGRVGLRLSYDLLTADGRERRGRLRGDLR